ncbi:conserved hypothetical protein [Ricinus communis]|uniref:Uncharacterized protein n=1 Tax=Ricinus communis TaxID=3988 RepID=B9RVE5_RICCO|nr:conserved hypothetical protein [Ricinus communis]
MTESIRNIALQAGNKFRSNVCDYEGVYCAQALDNMTERTNAGINLNHGDMAVYLRRNLGW